VSMSFIRIASRSASTFTVLPRPLLGDESVNLGQ
jgi:hypothetical protein